jgi:hypothetical protein
MRIAVVLLISSLTVFSGWSLAQAQAFPSDEQVGITVGYAVSFVGSVGFSLLNGYDLTEGTPGKTRAALGIGFGLCLIAVTGVIQTRDDASIDNSWVPYSLGAASVLLGVTCWRRASEKIETSRHNARISPVISLDRGRAPGVGVGVELDF